MTTTSPSKALTAALVGAVSPTWQTATEILPMVEGWAPSTIRRSLAHIAAAGLIDRRFFPHPGGTISKYRSVESFGPQRRKVDAQ